MVSPTGGSGRHGRRTRRTREPRGARVEPELDGHRAAPQLRPGRRHADALVRQGLELVRSRLAPALIPGTVPVTKASRSASHFREGIVAGTEVSRARRATVGSRA